MPRNYTNPLVTDAIIDLRVGLSPGIQVDALVPMMQVLLEEFPRQEPLQSQTVKFDFQGGDGLPTTESSVSGYVLHSENSQWAAQLTLEGFSFLHKKPYTGWLNYSMMARRVWNLYKEAVGVTEIRRAAVRYINRIDIPGYESLSDYLKLKPMVPDPFPSVIVTGFLMQLQMPQVDIESTLILNIARLADPNPDFISCVIDMDLSREHQWNVSEDVAVWELMDRIRERKNEFFEAIITDETRRMMGISE